MEVVNIEEVTMYKCKSCGETFSVPEYAYRCEFEHSRTAYANALLENGYSLGYINLMCGLGWKLRDDLKDVTKDNCFIISHWQCCQKPAYQIRRINETGYIRVTGKGGWAGYYGNDMSVDKLPKPHPKEDLFIYQGQEGQ